MFSFRDIKLGKREKNAMSVEGLGSRRASFGAGITEKALAVRALSRESSWRPFPPEPEGRDRRGAWRGSGDGQIRLFGGRERENIKKVGEGVGGMRVPCGGGQNRLGEGNSN